MHLSAEDIALITVALQERAKRLDASLPDPEKATPQDLANAREVMLLDALRNRLNPTHCGLHDRAEPCERCALYLTPTSYSRGC